MHHPQATVICDSISQEGIRLTTFLLRYWRPIHSELLTHRVFSRNAGSSRARPAKAIIEQVRTDPWGPLHWGRNQPGMQAHAELSGPDRIMAGGEWWSAAESAADHAERLVAIDAHKQIVNRVLEPYTFIDVVVTATSYANWFALRDHPDAQPEIQHLARAMKAAYEASTPKLLLPGEWHLPFIEPVADRQAVINHITRNGVLRVVPHETEILQHLLHISTSRCARTSYKAFDSKVAPVAKDEELFHDLLVARPVHASPAEHQATPDTVNEETVRLIDEDGTVDFVTIATAEALRNVPSAKGGQRYRIEPVWDHEPLHGNFTGWCQHRKTIPHEVIPG